jgi:hypothetical protein
MGSLHIFNITDATGYRPLLIFYFFSNKATGVFRQVIAAISQGASTAATADGFIIAITADTF